MSCPEFEAHRATNSNLFLSRGAGNDAYYYAISVIVSAQALRDGACFYAISGALVPGLTKLYLICYDASMSGMMRCDESLG